MASGGAPTTIAASTRYSTCDAMNATVYTTLYIQPIHRYHGKLAPLRVTVRDPEKHAAELMRTRGMDGFYYFWVETATAGSVSYAAPPVRDPKVYRFGDAIPRTELHKLAGTSPATLATARAHMKQRGHTHALRSGNVLIGVLRANEIAISIEAMEFGAFATFEARSTLPPAEADQSTEAGSAVITNDSPAPPPFAADTVTSTRPVPRPPLPAEPPPPLPPIQRRVP